MYPTSQYTAAAGMFGVRESQTASGISFWTGSNTASERVRIDSGGEVGIGTDNPGTKLHIKHGPGGSLSEAFRIADDAGYTNIQMLSGAADGEIKIGAAGVLRGSYKAQFAGTATGHSFNIGTGGTNAITIDANQNVGIGTTTPDSPLNVKGVFHSPTPGTSTHTGASSTQYPITNRSRINGRLNLSFNVYFQNATSNLAVRLYAPIASLWISGEAIIGSTYSYGNASGFRRYTFTHNQNSGTNYNYSLTNTENQGSTNGHVELHSHGWDGSEGSGAHYWEFRHIASSGNWIYCQFQTFGSGVSYDTASWYYRHVTY